MKSGLWAALLGSLAGGSALMLRALWRSISEGMTFEVWSYLPAVGGGLFLFLMPWIFPLGLLLWLWVRELSRRGSSRSPLALIALPGGVLLALALPVFVLILTDGPFGPIELFQLRRRGAPEVLIVTTATGLGIGLGVLIGLRKEPLP